MALGFGAAGNMRRRGFMDNGDDKIWEIVQRLYALAGLLQNWNGEAFDNDVLPGLGHLLADTARELQASIDQHPFG